MTIKIRPKIWYFVFSYFPCNDALTLLRRWSAGRLVTDFSAANDIDWELLQGSSNNVTTTNNGAISAGSAAVVREIPSIDVEIAPGMGQSPVIDIDQVCNGVHNVMRHLGMITSANYHSEPH